MAKTRVPAAGADGWFTTDPPALLGRRCPACGTVAFPPTGELCPNPGCAGGDLETVPLGASGRVWSYTDARYAPPPPFVARTDPYEPFALAAVELDGAGLVVLGQVVDGVGVDDLTVGQRMELTVGTLFEDDEHEYLIWRWRPADG